ncbi:hypothetical protein HNQ56_004002 [Anaerotaenia torta]|uniref:hypothetical protein n=1 Tax=Anaerotaenia torta TaxID=433293 RepID=UPI003D1A8C43
MISSLREQIFVSEPGVYDASCKVNGAWNQIVSPTRKQFIREGEFIRRPDESYACGQLYFPFEGEKVEYSGFWMRPTQLDFGARVSLCAREKGEYPFLLSTCGGAKLYINGVLQGSLMGYERNQEVRLELSLPLKKGENSLYIQCNDLAERDTQVYFKLRYLGSKELTGKIPASVDMEELERVRSILAGVYLKRFHYQAPDISLYFDKPVEGGLDAEVELAFTDAHTSLSKRCKSVHLADGTRMVEIGDLIYRDAGMVRVTLSSEVSGLQLKRSLQFEYYDESIMDAVREAKPAERKHNILLFLAKHGTPVFQRALALFETGGDKQTAMEIVREELVRINNRFDCSDFRLPAFFYALESPHVPDEVKAGLEEALLHFRYWYDEPGNDVMWFFSENHALCFHACEFLAGERYPERIFACSGMKGFEHREKAKGLLCKWFDNFLANGFSEWNSSVYIPIDVIGLLALYDHARDAQIRRYAREALDKTFDILACNSFKGIVAASYGRIYFKNLIGRRTSEASALNFIVSGEGWLNQNCYSTVLMALSGYRPEKALLSLYKADDAGSINESVQGEEKVRLYSYKTADYILASAIGYRPGERGQQEHVLQLMVQTCDTQIWINHPGEAVYFGEGRPSYFAGNGTLPLVEQNRNAARLTYDLLEQEVSYTHAYCPLYQFDEWIAMGEWLFLRKGRTGVGLYARNGLTITREGPLKDLEVISHGKHNVWYVTVDNMKSEELLSEFGERIMCEV